ncbi:MAG: Dabb family protein [Thermodesulfobacteriota bacterium]|nr:Dabb family protein [Thermodesulfobacteriota bacterium]
MINHVVLLKFKPEVKEADIENLEKLMDNLPNSITEIHSYEFGRDVVRSDRSYDFGLVALFANTEALGRYQVHPDHLVVLEKVKNMCNSVITVDFEGLDLSSLRKKTPESDRIDW